MKPLGLRYSAPASTALGCAPDLTALAKTSAVRLGFISKAEGRAYGMSID
jgi:hypothetical protein